MDKAKRERSANFTLQERDILMFLVLIHKNIIESKQSDGMTWKKKEIAWEKIKLEFNARSGGIYRSSKTLRIKYEGLKRTVRKKAAAIRSEPYRTGGGKNCAIPLDNIEEQINEIISLSSDGLVSLNDSDVLPQMKHIQELTNDNKSEDNVTVPIESVIENDILALQPEPIIVSLLDNTNPVCLEKENISSLNTKTRMISSLDELSQAKLEVLALQKQLLETELALKKEEAEENKKAWEFADKERKWREEEVKLKLEILRRDLNKKCN